MNELATNSKVDRGAGEHSRRTPALARPSSTYWYDVDFNEGHTAHEFLTPDGVKMVGHNRFEGREEIRAFYQWRTRQNVATAARQLGLPA
jgi:hypothetical protein